jgi:hypothetical protein
MLGSVVMNRLAVPWLLVVLLLGGGAQMQTPPARTPIDVSNVGPHVGETVPNFSLSDQNGRVQTRHSIMGSKGAMLVFVRSADW